MQWTPAFSMAVLAVLASSNLSASTQPHLPLAAQIQAPAPTPICALRTSVLESYGPFTGALRAGREAAAHTSASSQAKAAYARFDATLSATIAGTAPGAEATLALVDLERLVDTLDNCGTKLGWGKIMVQSRPALADALRRNRATLTHPDYAPRMLRSAMAQAVLREDGQGAVVDQAAALAERQREERAIIARQEAIDRRLAFERSEADRLQREELIRRGWRTNASAPAAGANFCDSHGIIAYANAAKDANWLSLMDTEARSGCVRISNRRDGPYYLGLALGTEVTDEQLAHATGRLFLCFSSPEAPQGLEVAINGARALGELFGGGAMGSGLKPSWTESTNSAGRRIVTVGCEIELNVLGVDLAGAGRDMVAASGVDQRSFVQFELTGSRLNSVRYRAWIPNVVESKTRRDRLTGSENTSTVCDADLARAGAIGNQWTQSQWAISQRLPYRFTNPGGAARNGDWMVLRRGTLAADIWNVSYDAPVLGEYGNCYGGIVEHLVTLNAERAARIKAGVPPVF